MNHQMGLKLTLEISKPQYFALHVAPVNNAPIFVTNNVTVKQIQGIQSQWFQIFTTLSQAPFNSLAERVHFAIVSISNPEIFLEIPIFQVNQSKGYVFLKTSSKLLGQSSITVQIQNEDGIVVVGVNYTDADSTAN